MKRSYYYVVPYKGMWGVKKRGKDKALATRLTKHAAVRKGKKIAKSNKPSQLLIHKKTGEIQRERTYSGDPFPPRDTT